MDVNTAYKGFLKLNVLDMSKEGNYAFLEAIKVKIYFKN